MDWAPPVAAAARTVPAAPWVAASTCASPRLCQGSAHFGSTLAAASGVLCQAISKRKLVRRGRPEQIEEDMLESQTDVVGAPLHSRIADFCRAGHGELVMEAPPNSLRCKTLVVSCTPGADNGEAAEVSAVLCVLPAERRLSLPKLKQALKAVDLRPVGLAAPQEAERLAGCSMGMVPPVCIEPKLPVYVDTRLFRGPRLVLGAAHEELHLAMSSRQLLLGTEGHVVDISLDSSAETPVATFPLRASSGSVVHVVAHIAAVRRLSRQLLFADLLPAGAALDAERSIWLSPDGSQRLVRLQLLVGRSLNERLGASGAAKVIKRLRPQQLIYVAGRLQLEEPGEQSGKVEPTAPEEVRKIREAQLTNGIVDMVAEQIRILEEAAPPRAVSEEDPLRLALPSGAVHYVAEEEGLRHLEGVLRERLRGSADLDPGETVTPVLPVIGLDAEWRPNTEGIALLQLAFRRSVFLLDMLALTNDPQLRSRLETALLPVLEAEHVYKVGFGLEEDLHRLGRALEVSRARSVLDLRHLARLALPNTEVAPGLSGLVRQVFGRGLDKTCQVSDWQARPLKQEQLDYAAQDAHVCVRLFDSLCYNHATLATQSLAPALSGVAKAWRAEKSRAEPEDKAAKGEGRGKGLWRPKPEVASRHVGHWRYLAKAEGEFRIQLDERGALVLCLADASGVLLPQEKRWLQAELATASGEAAGVARVRFSEKTESMQYVLPMAEEPTAAYRVMSAQEANRVCAEEAVALANKASRFIYMKKRKDFGRYCNFDTVEAKILGQVEKQPQCGDMYVEQTIINAVFHNIPEFSEHSVNTARVKTHARVMTHVEGGWPREIDYSEAQDTLKYRKRLEKDPGYISAVRQLTKQTIPCLEMNNTIDLFEIYFQEEEPDHMPEILNLKTIALFKDPSDEARSVTKIGWHPEGPTKLVGSYSNLRFQRMSEDMPMASFIWDIAERNVPLMELRATSPLICCQYNQKNPDWLLGGSYNGLINHYDLRKGPSPCMKSSVEVGHYDPVYDVVWLQSKTGTECSSVSSDGRLLFWDVRKLSEVLDECVLNDGNKEHPKTLGGVSLEWMQEAGPTKFLVGSEHGIILSCTKRPKKQVEIGTWFGSEDRGGYGKHFGPVYSVKRNPFHVKFFLSVGDWCAKMWMEELKGPMLQTPYYPAFISAAAWSPTRAGVFFLARQDGRLDVWDYFYRMNEVALTQQVSDRALTSLNVQSQGRLAAVGDAGGVITLLQLCDGLVDPGPNEKNMIGWMFDRETKREKSLEQIKKQGGQAKKDDKEGAAGGSIDKTEYQAREKAFFAELNMTGEDLGTTLPAR
ncbi:unnamed protein product [Effrenium voratum]|uniref:3'-5' exonuclease domain-containing protein n=1 Tax=Effrenium voratum TaxID=2562239 RepID=A0AA36I9F1_9DINO|nr:unnamed protein product [Effrenium voratum]